MARVAVLRVHIAGIVVDFELERSIVNPEDLDLLSSEDLQSFAYELLQELCGSDIRAEILAEQD